MRDIGQVIGGLLVVALWLVAFLALGLVGLSLAGYDPAALPR